MGPSVNRGERLSQLDVRHGIGAAPAPPPVAAAVPSLGSNRERCSVDERGHDVDELHEGIAREAAPVRYAWHAEHDGRVRVLEEVRVLRRPTTTPRQPCT